MSSSMVEYLAKTFRIILLMTFFLLCIRTFVVEPGKINGRSMEDTFIDEEVFLVNKYTLLFRKPRRGEIVQIYDPGQQRLMLKRIIGLPGEQVRISAGSVIILDKIGNQMTLAEPYLRPHTLTQSLTRNTTTYPILAEHEYFVMGDNRSLSIDSRSYGPIHRSEITGIVMTVPFLK